MIRNSVSPLGVEASRPRTANLTPRDRSAEGTVNLGQNAGGTLWPRIAWGGRVQSHRRAPAVHEEIDPIDVTSGVGA
jgi:hypothetical protein